MAADAVAGAAGAWPSPHLWSQVPAFRGYLHSLIKAGTVLPKLRDFQPVAFPALMPDMFVARVTAEGGLRLSLIGERLQTRSGWAPHTDYLDTYDHEQRARVQAMMLRLFNRPAGFLIRRETRGVQLQAACFPVADKGGAPLGFLGVAEARKRYSDDGVFPPPSTARPEYRTMASGAGCVVGNWPA